jgi:hypothetical protein
LFVGSIAGAVGSVGIGVGGEESEEIGGGGGNGVSVCM